MIKIGSYNIKMKTAILNVIGRIQEVGYKTRVIGLANVLDIKDYIKNLPDNSVEIIAQGKEEILKEFINDIKIQDPFIHVDFVKVTYSDEFEGFKDFHKIVGPKETDSRLDKAVDELKNVVTTINNMNENLKDIKEGNQEINENIKSMHYDLKEEIRKGNKASTNEIRDDIKAIKAHLKIP
jgi:acylphosphatase